MIQRFQIIKGSVPDGIVEVGFQGNLNVYLIPFLPYPYEAVLNDFFGKFRKSGNPEAKDYQRGVIGLKYFLKNCLINEGSGFVFTQEIFVITLLKSLLFVKLYNSVDSVAKKICSVLLGVLWHQE
jgi:hypothetical protein